LRTLKKKFVPLRQNVKIQVIMAIYIKPIPTLTGEVAEKFEKIARENEAKRGTVDFSQQMRDMETILERSKQFKIKHGLS